MPDVNTTILTIRETETIGHMENKHLPPGRRFSFETSRCRLPGVRVVVRGKRAAGWYIGADSDMILFGRSRELIPWHDIAEVLVLPLFTHVTRPMIPHNVIPEDTGQNRYKRYCIESHG